MRPIELGTEIFDRLVHESGSDLISILIPTHQRGRDVVQDPIRLKNQLSSVDDELEDLGWKPRERASRLAAARDLLEDNDFWEHQSAGLAIYVDDQGGIIPVSIPVAVESLSYVAEVFHLRHLVAGMGLARVPILVLTKKVVRLLYGSKFAIDEIEADLPESFDDVNWFVDREIQRQQHPDRVGSTSAIHGHDPSARAQEDRSRFLRAVADAIPKALLKGPLVVLGDDDLVDRFGQVSDLETASPKNSGLGSPHDDPLILDLARPALVQIETAREAEFLKQALDNLGVGKATGSIVEALPAAVAGQIQDVVMQRGLEPIWGRLRAQDMSVEVHAAAERGDVDLLDRLVVESRRTGAGVTTTGESIEGDGFIASKRY